MLTSPLDENNLDIANASIVLRLGLTPAGIFSCSIEKIIEQDSLDQDSIDRVHIETAPKSALISTGFFCGSKDKITLSPAKERHLAHEAWHTVQQASNERPKPKFK